MSMETLRGVIPPVPTILKEDGAFDPQGMAALIDRQLATDVNGFLFLGSAGEFAHLPMEVRKEVAEFCVARVARRKPVIIGTAACGTAEAVGLSKHAASIGADAVMVVNPYYTLLNDERLYKHYRTISESVSVPVLLYNFPALTGQDLSPGLVKRLARDCPNINGIKDTVDCLSHVRQMILEVKGMRPDFLVFCGYDEYLLSTLLLGGDGAIPATSNFAPEITCGIYKAFQKGDMAALQSLVRRLGALSTLYATDVPFTGLVKEAIRLTGSDISTAVASPATPPDETAMKRLVEILDQAQIKHS